jgi:hypothetical protein
MMIPATKATGAHEQYFRGETDLLLPILKAFVPCALLTTRYSKCLMLSISALKQLRVSFPPTAAL